MRFNQKNMNEGYGNDHIEDGNERLTLKNAIAFVDVEYPSLVFMIPKHKRWLPKSFSSSVYMVRGDPTLSLQLEVGSELSLTPRKFTSRAMQRYFLDNPVTAIVETIDFAVSARRAELTLSRFDS